MVYEESNRAGLLLILIMLAGGSGCATLPSEAIQRVRKANSFYQTGQVNDAKRLLNLVIRNYPKTRGIGEAYYIRGLCHLREEADRFAQADFQKALKSSKRPELLSRVSAQLGHMNYVQENYALAARYYATALADFPNKPPKDEVYYRYGDCLQKIGKWRKARQALSKVWHLFPGSPLVTYAKRKFKWRHHYFTIQCGAFARKPSAAELATSLRQQRFQAATEVDLSNERAPYVVYVGSFPEYSEAQKYLHEVQRAIPDAFIMP